MNSTGNLFTMIRVPTLNKDTMTVIYLHVYIYFFYTFITVNNAILMRMGTILLVADGVSCAEPALHPKVDHLSTQTHTFAVKQGKHRVVSRIRL